MGRPTQHNHPPRPVRPPGEGQNNTRPLCDTRIPHPPTQARRRARQAWRRPQRQGHARTFPFPNPEAKTASADGTAPARVWESRTPPPAHHKGGARHGPPLLAPTPHRPHAPAQPHTATPATHSHIHAHSHTHDKVRHTGHTATRTPKTTHTHTYGATRPQRHTRTGPS